MRLRYFFAIENPWTFIGILMLGFSIGNCGIANGWWGP